MTGGPPAGGDRVPAAAASAAGTSAAQARSFVGRRRRRSWTDWYAAGFALVIAAIYGSDFLASPLSRLSGPAGRAAATQAATTQAVAGTGLVIGVGAGLLLLAQSLGPLALSPADASWLLLTPLGRRAVLRRPALGAAALATAAGALLGILALAMAGPFLRPAGGSLPASWLLFAALAGTGCCLAGVAAEALVQGAQRGRAVARACCTGVAVIAAAGAVAGGRSAAVARAITGGFAGLTTPDLAIAAAAALALAAACWVALWRYLARMPAGVLRADSARTGRALMAAEYLNLPLLTWIAEDNHWRGRLIRSRPWPAFPPALALAWADWRRLGRRPGTIAVLAAAAVLPALAGAAVTGPARAGVTAAALLAGTLAAGLPGTAGEKRDLNDPSLRRLLGVPAGQGLVARAVLPALLSTGWLTLALTVLCALAVLPGWLWPVLGVAGPGMTAAVLRLARTAPVSPSQPVPDTPLGGTPPWLISRVLSLLVGVAGGYPLLAAVLRGHAHGATVAAQLAVSVIVLGGYLLFASRST